MNTYQTVYKVYKDYYGRLGVHTHLVGYFKSESLANKEINYLRCHELEDEDYTVSSSVVGRCDESLDSDVYSHITIFWPEDLVFFEER